VNIEVGKKYKLRDGMIFQVEALGEATCKLKLLIGANGKAPDDEWYMEGPSENLVGLFREQDAKEIS
jgi:hypothetical protein